MAFIDNGIFTNSFRGNQHSLPIVGGFENQQRDGVKVVQAVLSTTATAGNYSIGSAVEVENSIASVANQDVHTGYITQLATQVEEISGFVLRSATDIILEGQTAPALISGYTYNIGLIGSGIETWLPCDTSLQNVSLQQALTWDFTTQVLKKNTSGTALNIKLLSAVTQGVAVKFTTNVPSFYITTVVKVQL